MTAVELLGKIKAKYRNCDQIIVTMKVEAYYSKYGEPEDRISKKTFEVFVGFGGNLKRDFSIDDQITIDALWEEIEKRNKG